MELLHDPSIVRGPNKGNKFRIACLTPSRVTGAFSGPTIVQKYCATPPISAVPNKGDKVRLGYFTPAFPGVPNKWDKIRIGYITPAFSGDHSWAKWLCNLCIPRVPNKRGESQNGLPHTFAFSGAHKWA